MENIEVEIKRKPAYVITAEEVLELKVTEVPMLCPPFFEKVGVASLCGSSDVGKGFLSLCLAIAICSDEEEFLGKKINKQHGSVIMVCTEDAPANMCVRMKSLLGEKKTWRGKTPIHF